MFGIKLKSGGEKVIAIADIGSGSIGVCLAIIRKEGPATIIASEHQGLSFEERAPEQTMSGILGLLDEASQKVLATYAQMRKQNSFPAISSAYAIIRAPWTQSKTSRATTTFETEENITDNIIGELSKRAFAEEKQLNQANIFEAAVVRIELNEYPTSKPAGKRAHKVTVSALVSECEPTIRAGVIEKLQRAFSIGNPILRSGTRVLLAVLHKNLAQMKNCVVLDIGDEATNCLVIHKDVAVEHLLVPEGARTILKRIVGDGMPEETLSLMRMNNRDACNTPACEALNSAIGRVEPELVKIFGETMSRLATVRRLPNTLTLIVQPELAPWLASFFSHIDFGQFTVTTRPFATTVLAMEDIKSLNETLPGASLDTELALATGFVNFEKQNA